MKKFILSLSLILTLCLIKGQIVFAFNLQPPIKSEPMPSGSYQLAKAIFLPDYVDKEIPITPNENCSSYPLSSCPDHGYCTSCAFNRRSFKLESCFDPYLISGSACVCPPATPLTCTNDKCAKYCDGNCYEKSCTPSPDQTNCTNGTEKCDNGCCQNTRNCCVPCKDKIDSKPENSTYTYEACSDGDGEHQIKSGCNCNSGYHLKDGTCGKGGWCQKDCLPGCDGYTLTSCPTHGHCSSCTQKTMTCGDGDTKLKLDSCDTGYFIMEACYMVGGKNYGPLSSWTKENMGLN